MLCLVLIALFSNSGIAQTLIKSEAGIGLFSISTPSILFTPIDDSRILDVNGLRSFGFYYKSQRNERFSLRASYWHNYSIHKQSTKSYSNSTQTETVKENTLNLGFESQFKKLKNRKIRFFSGVDFSIYHYRGEAILRSNLNQITREIENIRKTGIGFQPFLGLKTNISKRIIISSEISTLVGVEKFYSKREFVNYTSNESNYIFLSWKLNCVRFLSIGYQF